MAEKIEKKISRVMRWLERCASACRGESYGNALMDIECARVDFDSARDEIWNTVNKRYNNKASVRGYFVRLFRTIATAAVILLSAAAPLSYIENTYSAMTTNSLEWVNSDEKALLKNLREQLSNANSGWVSDITDLPAETYLEAPKTEIKRTSNTYAGKEQISASRNDVQKVNTDMKNEAQIFTLLKIGENALKGKPSAVTVER